VMKLLLIQCTFGDLTPQTPQSGLRNAGPVFPARGCEMKLLLR
jgi:hypothetical protein